MKDFNNVQEPAYKYETSVGKILKIDEIKVNFKILKTQINKDGTCAIYLRIRKYDVLLSKDSTERQINSGIRVSPKSWSNKKNEVLKSDPDYINKNKILSQIKTEIIRYINSPNEEFEYAQLKKTEFSILDTFLDGLVLKKKTPDICQYLDEYIRYRKSLNHPYNTIKEFTTLRNRLKRFDDFRKVKTFFKDINLTWSDKFELWLLSVPYDKGTIEKTYTILITFLNHYHDRESDTNISVPSDFKKKTFKRGIKSRNEANPLTKEQFLFLFKYEFKKNKHFEKVRKMVLLQCTTGCRFDDIKKFRPQNFEINTDNKTNLKFVPTKTNNYRIKVIQPLNDYSESLFQEVNFDTSCYSMQNQPYNRAIKDMFSYLSKLPECADLHFKNDYTSHNFRDTFISNAVQDGINFKSILEWVGQSSYAIMDRYINLNEDFQHKEMEKLYKK